MDGLFQMSEAGHGEEHSLEVHLPFLQRVLPGARLVPIVLSEQTPDLVTRVGRALAQAVRERPALLVASSDLYHGHDEGMCRGTDKKTLEAIVRMDPDRFLKLLSRREIAACGGGPVGALMVAARELGADRAEVLARTNSSEASGRTGGYIVGYAAVAFVRGGARAGSPDRGAARGDTPPPDPAPLDGAARLALLSLARESVERAVRGEPPPDIPKDAPAAFRRRSGAFVTLHRGGRLRGCIGYVEAQFPLARAVIDMARAAALEDFRFPSMTEDELEGLDIEISVLSEPAPVDGPARVEPGRHGLIVARGRQRGLLLPQVATEQGWDRMAFVSHTCLKAGLPADAWKDPETELLVFEAQVFGSGAE
jgi:AmmeMemoRadiSam system protein A